MKKVLIVLLAAIFFITCSSQMISVKRAPEREQAVEEIPTFETSKVRSQTVTETLNGSAEQVRDAVRTLLMGLDVEFDMIGGEEDASIRIQQTSMASRGKEVMEFFSYKKMPEDASFWNFDDSSLESGRVTVLARYLKKPGGGLGGFFKLSGDYPMKIREAYCEGKIEFKLAGRARTNVVFELLYFTPDVTEQQILPCQSTGQLEKEWAGYAKDILAVEGRVFPGTPEQVKEAVKGFLGKNKFLIDKEWDGGFLTDRIFFDRKGERTVDKFTKMPRQLLALWMGTCRAVFLFEPVDNGAETRVKPIFIFMVINGNNGERHWMVRPSKGVLEEELFTDLREATKDFR